MFDIAAPCILLLLLLLFRTRACFHPLLPPPHPHAILSLSIFHSNIPRQYYIRNAVPLVSLKSCLFPKILYKTGMSLTLWPENHKLPILFSTQNILYLLKMERTRVTVWPATRHDSKFNLINIHFTMGNSNASNLGLLRKIIRLSPMFIYKYILSPVSLFHSSKMCVNNFLDYIIQIKKFIYRPKKATSVYNSNYILYIYRYILHNSID